MASAQQIVLQYVCPGLGAGIALIMFASPMRAVREVNKRKYLGDLNALPFAMMVANCICWIIYGFLNRDYFIYLANIPGLTLGLYYVLVCYKFSKEAAQDALTYILLATCGVICLVGLLHLAVIHSFANAKTLWGATAVAILGLYYSAPMSTLYRVIKTRCSASLHWPLCLMNGINGFLWFAYGLALKDWFVCVPNGVGGTFNILCIGFCIMFPRGDQPERRETPHIGRSWTLLRLQSARFPAADAAGGSADEAGSSRKQQGPAEGSSIPIEARAGAAAEAGGSLERSHSFWDVSAMRWRTGRSFMLGSWRLSSRARLLSWPSGRSGSLPTPGPAEAQGAELRGVAPSPAGPPEQAAAEHVSRGSDVERALQAEA